MYINIVVVVGWFPACCPAAHLSIFISRSLLSHTVARSLSHFSHLLSLPAAAAAESVYLMPTCSPGSWLVSWLLLLLCLFLLVDRLPWPYKPPALHACICMYNCMCACTFEHVCMHLCIHICPHCCCSCCLRRSCCLPCIVFIKFYIHTNICIHIRVRVYAWSCLKMYLSARHYPHYICTYAWIYIHTYMHMYACVLCDCV